MPDSRNQNRVFRIIDVINNPVISNPDSIGRIVQFFRIHAARVFDDFVEFLNEPFTNHSLHAREIFVGAGGNKKAVRLHYVLNVHEVRCGFEHDSAEYVD